MKIYVIGHKIPDLDAISSAVEYAEFLKKQKRYEGSEIMAVRAGEPNKETQHIFKKFGVEIPQPLDEYIIDPTDAFILVDHNELDQRHEKVINEQIIEIVDHHKINVNFTSPVRIDVKPLGSTSTVVYEHFEMYGLKPSKETTSLILASILSDTVGLKSSTTTGMDSEIAHKIAKELEMDIEKLTFEIFKAKSDVGGLSAMQIAEKDFKIFDFGGTKIFIGQVETVEPEKVLEQKEKLIKALEEIKVKHASTQAYLFVTDILKINSHAIYATEEEKKILEKAFMGVGEGNVIDVGPKMSRKKDIAPEIEKAIKSTPNAD